MDSFVKITRLIEIKKCIPIKDSYRYCKPGTSYTSTGSGVIISSNNNGSLILSAGHMCDVEGGLNSPHMKFIEETKRQISVTDIKGGRYFAEVRYYELGEGVDLCLLFSRSFKNQKRAKLSANAPKVGDRVYNIAAPAGIFHPPAVPILDGFYSGIMMPEKTDMYTVPAVGGSSGSPVFNEKFEIVGIIFAASRSFTHMSIATTYERTLEFLRKAAQASPKIYTRAQPKTFKELISTIER